MLGESQNDTVRVARRAGDSWEEVAVASARVDDKRSPGSMWVDVDLAFNPGDVVTFLNGKGYEVVGSDPVDGWPVRRVYLRRVTQLDQDAGG